MTQKNNTGTDVEYQRPASGDDFYQGNCAGCGWFGPERHIDDYADPADGLGGEFAEQFAAADADLHEFYGCEAVTTEKRV